MRKIEFRGKRIDNGEWIYGNLIIDEITDKYYITLNVEESEKIREEGCLKVVSCEVIPETVGQYIGYIDGTRNKYNPNGKEIYENDIMSYNGNILYGIYIVEWDYNYGHWTTWGKIGQHIQDWCNEHMIIGNIYENPELLEN